MTWSTVTSRLSIALALVAIGLLTFHTINEPDMGFHLRAGQWMIEHRTWPETDILTYTVPDHPYVDMHWLYQVTAWTVYSIGGDCLYVLFHGACVLIAFGLTTRQAMLRNGSPHFVTALLLLSAAASDHRFSVRPEVISWIHLVLVIDILERYTVKRSSSIFLLPIIMMLWVNTQGVFILGLGAITCYLIDNLVRHRRFDRRFWTAAAASVLATGINPYGLDGVSFPFILATRLSGANRFAASIGEFLSPWSLNPLDMQHGILFMVWSYYIVTGIVLLLFVTTLRHRSLRHGLLLVMTGVLAAQAIRNIPLFCLVAIPVAAEAARDASATGPWIRFRRFVPAWITTCGRPLLLIISILFILTIMTNSWYVLSGRVDRIGCRIENTFLPVQAAAFLSRESLDGRILNELRYGGYLAWQWQRPVFIDGRLEVMEHAFFQEYELARRFQSPWSLVTRWHPDIAVFGYRSTPGWFDQFYAAREWRLIHWDPEAVVFARDGIADRLPEITPETLAESLPEAAVHLQMGRPLSATSQSAEAQARVLPQALKEHFPLRGFRRFILIFTGIPAADPETIGRAQILLRMGRPDLAEPFFLQALVQCRGYHPNIWRDLGRLYLARQDLTAARICIDAVLSVRPEDDDALLMRDRLLLMQRDTRSTDPHDRDSASRWQSQREKPIPPACASSLSFSRNRIVSITTV
ncbi:tetratricopeptide repeat protein [bacterium]|nr:tetratricopeptide repeat protein [candidate division CSSED10-310 bacterium]